MLLQIDGSIHDRLEDRGPRMTLLLAVDDAIWKVPAALFREQSDAHGYFCLLRKILEHKGIPMALYNDGHAVFWDVRSSRKRKGESPGGRRSPTQFGQGCPVSC